MASAKVVTELEAASVAVADVVGKRMIDGMTDSSSPSLSCVEMLLLKKKRADFVAQSTNVVSGGSHSK